MQNGVGIAGVPSGIGGDQPGQMAVHRGDPLIVHQLVRGSGGELLAGDKFAQVQRIVVRQQADHVVTGVKDQLADGSPVRLWLAEQRSGFFHMRAKAGADKIRDPLGAGEV